MSLRGTRRQIAQLESQQIKRLSEQLAAELKSLPDHILDESDDCLIKESLGLETTASERAAREQYTTLVQCYPLSVRAERAWANLNEFARREKSTITDVVKGLFLYSIHRAASFLMDAGQMPDCDQIMTALNEAIEEDETGLYRRYNPHISQDEVKDVIDIARSEQGQPSRPSYN